MKKRICFLTIAICLCNWAMAQQISPYLLGNNAWLAPWHTGSQTNNLWDEMQASGMNAIRVGGFGAQNANDYTKERLGTLAQQIRQINAEPVIQVPSSFTAAQTTTLVSYINGTMGLNVKYWAIGNEPDLNNSSHTATPVASVAAYIRTISSALKAYDPTIKTIGPALAWYDTNYLNPLFVNKGADDVSGKDANGNYYIDIIDWHKYGIASGSELDGSVNSVMTIINNINATRPTSNKMSWAITELNGHYDNSIATDDQKCWSFNAGQMFAEVFDIGMRKGAFSIMPWSIFEGGGMRGSGDLGVFEYTKTNCSGTIITGRSTYYHTLMLGSHFKTNYLVSEDNQSAVTVSSMGDANGFSVMVINKSDTQNFDYAMGLNYTYGTVKTLRIRVNAGVAKEFVGRIGLNTTQMLVFSAQGNLLKKYEYSATDADNRCGPSVTEFTGDLGNQASMSMTWPVNGAKVEVGTPLTVSLSASHPTGIQSVDLFLNNSLVGSVAEAPYVWDGLPQLVNLAIGSYELKAVARLADGQTMTHATVFRVADSQVPPLVAFTYPVDGQVFPVGTNLKVTNVSASHKCGISNVKLYLNGVLVRQENVAPYDWGLDGQNDTKLQNLPQGEYVLKAEATSVNNEVASASVKITVGSVTGVAQSQTNALVVSPNPTRRHVTLSNISDYKSLQLISLQGKTLANYELSKRNDFTLDLSAYPKGIFFVRLLVDASSNMKTILLVKE